MPNPNEDNPIQKLWEYIPPYTAPNYPPHVEVITTTNTGDTPMFEFRRGNYEQKSRQILEATEGLSSTNAEGTHLIECLRSQLSAVTEEMERLRFGWECYKNYINYKENSNA